MPKGLLIAIGHAKGKGDEDGYGEEHDGDEEGEEADVLADLLHVDEADRDHFKKALKMYVESCVEKSKDEEHGEEKE